MSKDYAEVLKKIDDINKNQKKINIMEVCGTHTHAIGKFALRQLLNENINLISGPGCPVCVTPDIYIDYIYGLSLKKEIIIATYGDMIRVPGSTPDKTLEKAKALGAIVKIIYSSIDALEIAEKNPDKLVVFLGIGFETTTPATAIAILEAQKRSLGNFYVLSAHKIVEPVMRLLLEDEELNLDGFLIPGHVAAIIGETGFKFMEEYNCTGVVAGFSLEEIVEALHKLVININVKNNKIFNCYENLVKKEGNITAVNLINRVFNKKNDFWRGMGLIENSGYKIRQEYHAFDIENLYPMDIETHSKKNGCRCGEVLKGKIKPTQCPLFKGKCTPDYPVGPCMVSSEGTCAAYFRYHGGDI